MAHNNNQKRGRNQRRRPGQGNANRAMDSTGPDVKIRGTVVQIYDKYQNLARDAQSSGDRIKAENLLQHAEHYYRLMRMLQPKDIPAPDPLQGETRLSERQEGGSVPDDGAITVKNRKSDSPEKTKGDAADPNENDEIHDEVPPDTGAGKKPVKKATKQAGRKRAPRKPLTQNGAAPGASDMASDPPADSSAPENTMATSRV